MHVRGAVSLGIPPEDPAALARAREALARAPRSRLLRGARLQIGDDGSGSFELATGGREVVRLAQAVGLGAALGIGLQLGLGWWVYQAWPVGMALFVAWSVGAVLYDRKRIVREARRVLGVAAAESRAGS